jgi:hypothetical protein
MPPELVPILAQFPVVALVFIAAWVVLKWADRRHEQELAREEVRTAERRRAADAEIQRVRDDASRARADHQAELQRVRDDLQAEIARLRRRNTQLQAELDASRTQNPRTNT